MLSRWHYVSTAKLCTTNKPSPKHIGYLCNHISTLCVRWKLVGTACYTSECPSVTKRASFGWICRPKSRGRGRAESGVGADRTDELKWNRARTDRTDALLALGKSRSNTRPDALLDFRSKLPTTQMRTALPQTGQKHRPVFV